MGRVLNTNLKSGATNWGRSDQIKRKPLAFIEE